LFLTFTSPGGRTGGPAKQPESLASKSSDVSSRRFRSPITVGFECNSRIGTPTPDRRLIAVCSSDPILAVDQGDTRQSARMAESCLIKYPRYASPRVKILSFINVYVERGISRDFAARQTECDERILRQDGRMTFSLRRQGEISGEKEKAPPPARLPPR
jgi:hypothetical protein